jgi:hypothetical protein
MLSLFCLALVKIMLENPCTNSMRTSSNFYTDSLKMFPRNIFNGCTFETFIRESVLVRSPILFIHSRTSMSGYFLGNTAQRLCVRCAVRFFVRLCKNRAGRLSPVKGFLCEMTENMQADDVQNRQMFFVRCCL